MTFPVPPVASHRLAVVSQVAFARLVDRARQVVAVLERRAELVHLRLAVHSAAEAAVVGQAAVALARTHSMR